MRVFCFSYADLMIRGDSVLLCPRFRNMFLLPYILLWFLHWHSLCLQILPFLLHAIVHLSSWLSWTLAVVVVTVCTKPLMVSTPIWAFIPKCHFSPFLVELISSSRFLSSFFVLDGAAIMVASTMVPAFTIIFFASKCWFTQQKSVFCS